MLIHVSLSQNVTAKDKDKSGYLHVLLLRYQLARQEMDMHMLEQYRESAGEVGLGFFVRVATLSSQNRIPRMEAANHVHNSITIRFGYISERSVSLRILQHDLIRNTSVGCRICECIAWEVFVAEEQYQDFEHNTWRQRLEIAKRRGELFLHLH
jgi:hypothetical protein